MLQNPGDYIKEVVIKNKKLCNNKYFIPQIIGRISESREIDQKNKNSHTSESTSTNIVLSGFSGFSGKITGKIITPSNLYTTGKKQAILVLSDVREIDPYPFLNKITALILENGSPFEHIGIWAREHGIPSIFNVKGVTKYLKSGDNVIIDGDAETVRVL